MRRNPRTGNARNGHWKQCWKEGIIYGLMMVCAPLLLLAQEGNPRHPGIVHFEELGRFPVSPALWALGDVSGDGLADFATERYLDTCYSPSRCAQEILIHYGVQGAVPSPSNGFVLQSGILLSKMSIIAVGDWDDRNGNDLCVQVISYTDTSYGNTDLGYSIFRTIIFWNNGSGEFSIDDTTHIWSSSKEMSNVISLGASYDINRDGRQDLIVKGSVNGMYDGELHRNVVPQIRAYFNNGEKRLSSTPDWSWWNALNDIDRMYARDLDHDDTEDLIFSANKSNSPLVVLYGSKDENIPDTIADKQQITINGLESDFSDVTGDNYPDLIILNSAVDEVYCYVSTPSARRLQDMFGTGNDPPREGEWWSRPWATLKGPRLVNQFWTGLDYHLFPVGSADTSAPDEIWLESWPYVIVYQTGTLLDSLIDAEIDLRIAGGSPTRLGDIDGDGREEFMMAGGTAIFRFATSLPTTVLKLRRLPEGTDRPDSLSGIEREEETENQSLALSTHPNPSSGEVVIEWDSRTLSSGEQAIINITDILGQEVLHLEVPASLGRTVWDASRTFSGVYFVTVTAGSISQTERITIQQ